MKANPESSELPRIEAADHERVERELFALLGRVPGSTVPALILCALAVVALLWQPGMSIGLGIWFACVVGVALWRRTLCRRLVGRWAPEALPALRRSYATALLASGLLWAVPLVLFFPEESPHRQLVLVFLVAGLAATAATLHNAVWWAFAAVAAPPLVAVSARFFLGSSEGTIAMGLLTLSFLATLVVISGRMRETLTESLRLRYRNETLAQEQIETSQALREQARQQERVHDELRQRDEILQAVRFAAGRLLHAHGWESDPTEILERLGEAACVTRVAIVHHRNRHGREIVERSYCWHRAGCDGATPEREPLFAAGHEPWQHRLKSGEAITGCRGDFGPAEAALLDAHGIRSLALFPIHVELEWWGVLAFEDGENERSWSEPEIEALTSAADMFAAALHGIRTIEELRSTDDRFRMLAENTSDLVCLHAPDGRFLYASPSSQAVLGYRPFELMGRDPLELLDAEDRDWVRRTIRKRTLRGEVTTATFRVRRRRGDRRWLETTIRPIADEPGQSDVLITSSRDVSVRKHAEEQLRREKELAQVTLSSIGDGVVTTDADGCVQYLNPVARRLLGVTRQEAAGQPLRSALHVARPGSARIADIAGRVWGSRRVESSAEPIVLQDADGEDVALEVTCAPILDGSGEAVGTVTVLHDVTRTRKMAEQLSYQARHDPLTGLMNRKELEERVRASGRRRRQGEIDALCYLDLDQFKVVNDTCGHIAGDELLRQLAGVLETQTRRSDVVARLGGDEFGILLSRCPPERAESVANSLCEAIRSFRFTWEDKIFQLGASIGVVPITGESSVTELLSAADAACYAAKDQGRNRVHLFTPDDRTLAHRKGEMEWVAQIHGALVEDRFELCFQPIVETKHDSIEPHRIEILLTMITESGDPIPPGTFIPAAERFNTMPAIDRWVVARSIATFAEHWRGPDPLVRECFLNLSGNSLTDRSFGPFVKEQIEQHRVPPGVLCFEITETAAITNLVEARRLIEELREMGCRFALDDFGSGLSSFAYLRSLPVDFLKIDGVFVKDVDKDSVDYSIVESIHRVGQMLGLRTIAESVESRSVLECLGELGVDFVQGFGLARPAPVAELLARIEEKEPEGQSSSKQRTEVSLPRQQTAAQ